MTTHLAPIHCLSLNGIWDVGTDRQYTGTAVVPGLAVDPAQVTPGTLWYRRQVTLPPGDWHGATLRLNGARFCPAVYVNGTQVSRTEGGMTATVHPLVHPDIRPGATVTMEVALKNLDDTDPGDASRIPGADRWRSNIASCLWDDVTLKLHGTARLTRVVPHYDPAADTLTVAWAAEGTAAQGRVLVEVLDAQGVVLASGTGAEARIPVALDGACRRWSPEAPQLYRLRVTLRDGDTVQDVDEFAWAPKEFRIAGKAFRLNGEPVTFRAGSVVWHRWVRDAEGREVAWDAEWFAANVARRLQAHGANGLRFHLGMPPERLLDLCDQLGLLVQVEWSFFHGMQASKASLLRQWRDWFDRCMRHPSVSIIHPWNETEGDELDTAFAALAEIAPEYPPLVIAHRDTLHVHKYWWGLFENVGIYYDAADQFPQPIVVDEFGGNYLDGNCEPGGYPALKESFLRFLGRGHTKALRLELHTEANARVAEYWRRLGAAGFSPFCIAGSWEDGNHHFLGPLREGRPKPVWAALTAAYAPVSVSLDVWDRNFTPGQQITLPLYLFNETAAARELPVEWRVVGADGAVRSRARATWALAPHATRREEISFTLPAEAGDWRLEAELLSPQPGVQHPVISSWRVRTLTPTVPAALRAARIGVPADDAELRAFVTAQGLTLGEVETAEVILTGRETWERLETARAPLEAALARGARVVMLDIGPRELGQGYLEGGDLGPLQGARWIPNPGTVETSLFAGLTLEFREMPEPESCLHPSATDASLWQGLAQQATWLWNGLRGGLVVPARDMGAIGLRPDAFLAQWAGRGADLAAIQQSADYLAYELAGFYAFSHGPSDTVQRELRARVQFLVDDAPALAVAINPQAPIETHHLATRYRQSADGQAEALIPLAQCGKNLARTPVIAITFGAGRGTLVLSQLLTTGRLVPGFGTAGPYGLRYDPAAAQLVLNMLVS